MTTAVASLVTGRPVKAGVGMTGEVTLQGRVLPIGGLKQKLLAAHRAGLTDVVIPAGNEPDLDDVPENVRDLLHVHPVQRRTRGPRARTDLTRPSPPPSGAAALVGCRPVGAGALRACR